MNKLIYRDLTFAIIGAAMEVHRQLGRGFLEAVYEKALAHELGLRGIHCQHQRQLKISYKGMDVGHYVADLVVEDVVIVELKATAKGLTKAHQAQLINYLVATQLPIGLLLNFGMDSLQHKRMVRTKKA